MTFASHRMLARMPERLQRILLDRVLRYGLAERFALFQMFRRTLVAIGADTRELDEAFAEARDVGPSLAGAFRRLAERLLERAPNDPRAARRASTYALVADWATTEPRERRRNYDIAIAAFDVFARASRPVIERAKIPFRSSGLAAYFVTPPGATGGVLLIPGNDEPKEWMIPMAEAACARGLAALALDLPGYGESHLWGTRLDGRAALEDSARAAADWLAARGVVRIGTFGVSLGGLVAHLLAALEPRIGASTGIGGPFNLEWVFARVPFVQRRRFALASEARDEQAVAAFVRELDAPALLRAVRGPALVVHGTNDVVVPFAHAQAIAQAIGGGAELRAVDGGDHMANPHLARETSYMMDWLVARLSSHP
jgi:pimeloyl-ACP methyl ester carboxylesterase